MTALAEPPVPQPATTLCGVPYLSSQRPKGVPVSQGLEQRCSHTLSFRAFAAPSVCWSTDMMMIFVLSIVERWPPQYGFHHRLAV